MLNWDVTISVDAQKTTLLFAFGDSYADVGNLPKTGPNRGKGWVYPYGITWPSPNGVTTPAGRFSDGKIQTDWIGKFEICSVFKAAKNLVSRISQSRDFFHGMCHCHYHEKVAHNSMGHFRLSLKSEVRPTFWAKSIGTWGNPKFKVQVL